jgi:hypothetical protein
MLIFLLVATFNEAFAVAQLGKAYAHYEAFELPLDDIRRKFRLQYVLAGADFCLFFVGVVVNDHILAFLSAIILPVFMYSMRHWRNGLLFLAVQLKMFMARPRR